jgi:signal peptidase I
MAKSLDQIRAEQKKAEHKKKGSAKRGATLQKSSTAAPVHARTKPEATSGTAASGIKKSAKAQNSQHHPEHELTLGMVALSWLKTLLGAIVLVMILNGLLIASFVVPTGSMENTVMTGDFLFVNKFIYGPSTPQMIPIVNIPIPYYRFPGLREPQKGDVIVFVYPGDRDELKPRDFLYYLKRCVATGGDVVEIRNKELFVNGVPSPLPPYAKPLDMNAIASPAEGYRMFPEGSNYTRDNYGPVRVPKKGDIINLTPDNIAAWRVFIIREGHEVRIEGTTIMIDNHPATQYTVQRDYCFGMGDNRDNSEDSRYWGFIPVENVVGTPMITYWSWDTNLVGESTFGTLIEKFKTIRFDRIGLVIR